MNGFALSGGILATAFVMMIVGYFIDKSEG